MDNLLAGFAITFCRDLSVDPSVVHIPACCLVVEGTEEHSCMTRRPLLNELSDGAPIGCTEIENIEPNPVI